jgi:hypothetical protein
MITVKAYLYPNIAEVQFFDSSIFNVRNRVVYSRPIKVYQGIDNPVQVIVRNQDQKAYNLSGFALQVDIQDPVNQVTVNSYAVAFASNVALEKGQGTFTIDSATLNSMEQRFYKLTFKTINTTTNAEQPVYIDDNYGAPLDLQVLPAYYSSMEPTPFVDDAVLDGGVIANPTSDTEISTIDNGTL